MFSGRAHIRVLLRSPTNPAMTSIAYPDTSGDEMPSRRAAVAQPVGRSSASPELVGVRRIGLVGALLLLTGGLFAGTPPSSVPLLQQEALQVLRSFMIPMVAIVYVGLSLLVLAWWRLGRIVRSAKPPTVRELIITLAWWATPVLVSMPLFSKDVYSYFVQGAITIAGVDPYQHGPHMYGGPLTADIPQIWQTTPAPYGPVFLSLAIDVALLAGPNAWLGALGMRALAVVGVALMCFAIPRLARYAGVNPSYGLWLGVLNPIVIVRLVGDAHNDAIMIGLMLAGLTLAIERRPAVGAVLATLGALVKAPAGLALAFILVLWATQLQGRWRFPRAGLGMLTIVAATVAATTVLAGTGYGWVKALSTPAIGGNWTSITHDLGIVTGSVAEGLGVGTTDSLMTFWRYAGLAAAAIICLALLRRHWFNPTLGVGLGLATVVALGPVFHPWYALWATVPLAAAATSPRIRKLVIVLIILLSLLAFPSGVIPSPAPIAGGLLGMALVFGGAWAAANLDRDDLVGSWRRARRGLTVPRMLGRVRDAWHVPTPEKRPARVPASVTAS